MVWKRLTGDGISKDELREMLADIRGRPRFLVDENMGQDVATLVNRSGWNAVFANDVGLRGHDDSDIMAFAWREKRVILTHDDDFLDDKKFPFYRNPGVVVLPGNDGRRQVLVNALSRVLGILGHYSRMFHHPKIKVTEENHWTVRDFRSDEGMHTLNRYKFDEHGNMYQWSDDE